MEIVHRVAFSLLDRAQENLMTMDMEGMLKVRAIPFLNGTLIKVNTVFFKWHKILSVYVRSDSELDCPS